MQPDRSHRLAVVHHDVGNQHISDAAYGVDAVQLRAQGARYGRSGVQKIDVYAARPIVSRRVHLF